MTKKAWWLSWALASESKFEAMSRNGKEREKERRRNRRKAESLICMFAQRMGNPIEEI